MRRRLARGRPAEGARISLFLGRDGEIAELAGIVDDSARLVGIWGPFGVGKTRLARELCGALARSGRPWSGLIVDLAAASAVDAGAVPAEDGGAPRLVVLDGADRHLDALAALIPSWVARDGSTTFVVTSRERCRLEGARSFELAPLGEPAEGAAAADAAAVRLFLDRAKSVASRTESPPGALPSIAQIVTRLERFPLLVERAAALSATVGIDALLELAGDPIALLAAAPPHRGAARGAVLAAEVRASVALLPANLRRALATLARFAGGFTTGDAAAVLGSSEGAAAEIVVELRDRALLAARATGGSVRHRLWSMFRAEALAGERRGGRRAYDVVARRVTERAGIAARAFDATGARDALDELADRRADLVAVAERELGDAADGAGERAAAALAALDPLLLTDGPRVVAPALLDRAVEIADGGGVGPELRARLLAARSRSRALLGGARTGVADLERAVSLVRDEGADGSASLVASLLVDLGVLHHRDRELETASALYAAALELCTRADARTEARAIGNLAAIAHDRARLDDAAPEYERAIAIAAAAGDARLEAIFSANLAIVDQERGAMRSAQRRYERGVLLLEQLPDHRLLGITLGNLGMLHHEEGRLDAARRCHERALGELGLAGDAPSVALAHGRLAAALASEDRVEEARVEIERGSRAVPRSGGEIAAAVLRVATAYIDVALARRAVLEGRDAELSSRLARARRTIDEARAARGADGAPLVGTSDDLRTFLRVLERSLDASSTGVLAPPAEGLLVAPEARWFRPPGGSWHDLRQRAAARRILDRLCAHQRGAPGRSLGLEALREAGWPGERILPKAAKNRVYVVLNQLRELGLRRWIKRSGDGWALDPILPVHRVAIEPVGPQTSPPQGERPDQTSGPPD